MLHRTWDSQVWSWKALSSQRSLQSWEGKQLTSGVLFQCWMHLQANTYNRQTFTLRLCRIVSAFCRSVIKSLATSQLKGLRLLQIEWQFCIVLWKRSSWTWGSKRNGRSNLSCICFWSLPSIFARREEIQDSFGHTQMKVTEAIWESLHSLEVARMLPEQVVIGCCAGLCMNDLCQRLD